MELNREQIIKALEGMNMTGVSPLAIRNAIELIRKLTEEAAGWKEIAEGYQKQFEDCHARLTEENERLRAERDVLDITVKDLRYRNKELTAFNRRWAKECAELQDECEYIKADTVREMVEKIRAEKFHHKSFGDLVYVADIERIAKELEGQI